MSMSTHVVGFHPPDEKWKEMKAAWDACMAANVNPPVVTIPFNNYHNKGGKPRMSASLEISDCPVCKQKGKTNSEGFNGEIHAWVECKDGCDFFIDDMEAPQTTEIAKELLRHRAIRKWNAKVKEHKERNCI